MKDSLELIIEDLYSLDPSLREKDGEIRALLQAVVASKPVVEIDEKFVRNLRHDLLEAKTISQTKAKATPSPWWMVYGAPVGVFAVLVLMLLPRTAHLPSEAPTSGSDGVMQEEMFYDSAEAPAMNKRSIQMSDPSATMMMNGAESSFEIDSQLPGDVVLVNFLSLSEAGFIVVQEYLPEGPGEVLGTSPLLTTGLLEQFEISLDVATKPGQTLYAVLYLDNGDGVFSPDSDLLVYVNYTGDPLYQIFSVLSEASE